MLSNDRFEEIREIIQDLREGKPALDEARYALLETLDLLKGEGLVETRTPRPESDVPPPEVEIRTDGGHQPTKKSKSGCEPPRVTTVVQSSEE